MSSLAALHKLDSSLELIDDRLIATRIPPLCRKIVLSSNHDDPESRRFRNAEMLRRTELFRLRQVNVTLEPRDRNPDPKLLFKERGESMNKVERTCVAFVNERVVHIQYFNTRVRFGQRSEVRIVIPQRVRGCPDIRFELVWMSSVQVAHSRCQHQHITGTLKRSQYKSPHTVAPMLTSNETKP